MASQFGRHGGDERIAVRGAESGGGVGDGEELGLA
jgi:hypothetical protein